MFIQRADTTLKSKNQVISKNGKEKFKKDNAILLASKKGRKYKVKERQFGVKIS